MGKCACIKLMVAIRKKLQYKHYDEKKKKNMQKRKGRRGDLRIWNFQG